MEIMRDSDRASYCVWNCGESVEVLPVRPSGNQQETNPNFMKDCQYYEQSLVSAYRVRFCVTNKQRFFNGPKQYIRWVIGFANWPALQAGKLGNDCRGEEHEIEIVCTSKKRTGKVRVFWNKRNISNFFRSGGDLMWQTRSGETLQIIPNSNQQANEIFYDLVVDGVKFSDLPKVRDLGLRHFEQRSPTDVGEELNGTIKISDLGSVVSFDSHHSGKGSRHHARTEDDTSIEDLIKDELHSELFTPVLEPLRKTITETLPQTEEMVSRSIIGALFVDSTGDDSFYSLNQSFSFYSATQLETDLLSETFDWRNQATHSHSDDHALNFLETKMKDVFISVRNKHLSSDDAARIILSIASVLRLNFVKPENLPSNCIVLKGLKEGTTNDDICISMSQFGKVDDAAVSTANSGFGFCRFENCSSVYHALKASRNAWLTVCERRVYACPLCDFQPTCLDIRQCNSVNEGRSHLSGNNIHASNNFDPQSATKRKCVSQEERQISCATADCTEASVDDVTPRVITVVNRLSSW